MVHEANKSLSTLDDKAISEVKKSRLWLKLLVATMCGLIALGASMYYVYAWQHRKVTTQAVTIKSLNSNTAHLDKLNNSLKTQISQLSKQLQAALSAQSLNKTSSEVITQSQQPTSSLVITGIKQVPVTTYVPSYVPPAGGPTTYEEVDFTVYNNSNATQFYSTSPGSQGDTPVTNTYIKGVTSSGEVVQSYLSGNNGYAPWQASVLAGGSANGLALFNPASGVAKLQWLAPGSSQPVYIILPN